MSISYGSWPLTGHEAHVRVSVPNDPSKRNYIWQHGFGELREGRGLVGVASVIRPLQFMAFWENGSGCTCWTRLRRLVAGISHEIGVSWLLEAL